jgi:ribonuclease P protein component
VNSSATDAAGTISQRFTRTERVLRRVDFERAYNSGARISTRFMIVFVVANGSARARLGVAASRKFGPAVERNKAKRLAREFFRRHKPGEGLDVVIVPRREMLDATFSSLEADFSAALDRRSTAPRANPRRPRGSRPPRRHSGV